MATAAQSLANHANAQFSTGPHLIDAATGRQIWSDRFDRSVGDILTLQGEVTRSIAAVIRVRLTVG